MKRLFAIMLCLLLTVCFCACDIPFFGGDDDSKDTAATPQSTTAPAASTTVAASSTTAATTVSTSTTAATTSATKASSGGSLSDLTNKNNSSKTQSTTKKSSSKVQTTTKKSSSKVQTTTKKTQSATKKPSSGNSQQVTSLVYSPGQISTFNSVQNSGHLYNTRKNTIITTAAQPAGNTPVATSGGNTPVATDGGSTPGTTAGGNTPVATDGGSTPGTTASTVPVPTGGATDGTVITYPTSADLKTRSDISFKAGTVDVALYDVRVNHNHYYNANTVTSTTPVAMFEMTGAVNVTITYPVDVTSVIVRPDASGIQATASGKTVSFTIPKAGKYSVEINGKVEDAVLVFADDPHVAPSGDVVVKEAGLNIGTVTVKEGSTVYLAPGAVIRGSIVFNNVSGGKVCGRGIIDGSTYDSWIKSNAKLPIETWQSSNIELDGFFILDSNCWGIQIQQTSDVTINNIKIMTARPNGDGISLQSTHDVEVTNCFLRTWDDSLVVKNYGLPQSYNISFKNCVLWNDLANAMEIGFETNKGGNANPVIHDVSFEDIYVIHGLANSVISIHNGDNADIYDISYKNIVVDTARVSALIDISNNFSSIWSKVDARGTIKNVTFENITVNELTLKQISKIDATEGAVTGIKFINYNLLGTKVTTADAGGIKVLGGAEVAFA